MGISNAIEIVTASVAFVAELFAVGAAIAFIFGGSGGDDEGGVK